MTKHTHQAHIIKKKHRLIIVVFWVLFVLIDSLKKFPSLNQNEEYLLFYHIPGYLFWILFGFILNNFLIRAKKLAPLPRFAVLLPTGAFVGAMKVFLSWSLFFGLLLLSKEGPIKGSYLGFLSQITTFYFVEAAIISWMILAIFFLLETLKLQKEQDIKLQVIQTQLAKAQLNNLKMQLQPHFIFNANNTISMLIRQNRNQEAVSMIAQLSDLLRASLDFKEQHLIKLEEELDLLKKYLTIVQIRFEDRLTIEFDIETHILSKLVPPLILQPLIENAVEHGISKLEDHAVIKITIESKDDMLQFQIYNTGPEFEPNKTGIGLSNTQKRLEKLYGNDYQFRIYNHKKGVMVAMKLAVMQ